MFKSAVFRRFLRLFCSAIFVFALVFNAFADAGLSGAVIMCDEGFIAAYDPANMEGCQSINSFTDEELLLAATKAGIFNFLNRYPEETGLGNPNFVDDYDELAARARIYLSNYAKIDNLRDYLYSESHLVLNDTACPYTLGSACDELQSATNMTNLGTSWWYMNDSIPVASANPYYSFIDNDGSVTIFDSYSGRNWEYEYTPTGEFSGQINYSVHITSGDLTNPDRIRGLAMCPIGTRNIGTGLYTDCIEPDNGVAFDISLYIPEYMAKFGIDAANTHNMLILREHFGRGWSVVLNDDTEIWILDYENSNGNSQEGEFYYNENYIDPSNITFENVVDAAFAVFNEYYSIDPSYYINEYKNNNTNVKSFLEQYSYISDMMQSSTGFRSNMFVSLEPAETDFEVIWDNFPHHGISMVDVPSYTIAYNLNGGTGCWNTTYTSSDTVTLCTPTRDGYEFDGWYDNSGLTGTAVATIPTGSTGSKTYYAKWTEIEYPFTITTTSMTANDTFKWSISAAGTFYVDCGDGGVLSGTGVSGTKITRSNTTMAQYTCTYPNAGTHTIRFGGTATGYNANSGDSASYAAIGFSTANYSNNTPTKIAGISGSLGAIFGTIGNGDTLATQPRFSYTFSNCSGLTGSIPENLFSGISGAPAQYMFGGTFQHCSGLTGTIPENLFAGIKGAPAPHMFQYTFIGCSGLTGAIPANLFAGISGAPATYMFNRTFYNCSGLTGSIPANLFAGISGAPENNMFYGTFAGCSKLTGFTDGTTTTSYVPADFLSGIDTNTSVSNQVYYMFTGTGLASPCPANTYAVTRPQFSDAGKPWCAPCPDGTTSSAGSTSVDQCVASSYTITYNLNGGTGCWNTTYTSSDTVTLCTPTRDGYEFDGWYDNSGLTGTAVTTIPTGSTGNREYWAKWIEYKFQLTTTSMTANDTFKWSMSAAGTFYVDCGDGGVLSGTGVSGNTIKRTNTTMAQYTCTYPNAGTHTIRFGGAATEYDVNSGSASYAAIGFSTLKYSNNTPTKIAGISGSLGAIFGTIGNGDTLATQPRFSSTFYGCSGLTGTIPDNLFAGISGAPAKYMFEGTFDGCSGLTGSIPDNLFAGISGAPATDMFSHTFDGCSGLTGSIPENLFAGISGAPAKFMFYATFSDCSGLTGSIPENLFTGIKGAPANNMFAYTFYGCSGLTGSIPANLFAGISGAPAKFMFEGTFYNCGGLTGSIPENLFAGISGAPANGMFSDTFANCSGLTGSIPEKLFAGISGAPAEDMFYGTFYGCSGLTGFTDGTTTTSYVPADFLSGIDINTSVSNQASSMFTGTGLSNPCPANTYAVTREQFSNAGKPWCAPCPDGTTSPAGSTSVDQCVVPSYTITYNLNSGTGCSNTTYTSSDTVTLCTPTRDGYEFDGWYDNSGLTGTAVTEIASGSTGNKEYWAKWEIANGYYLDDGVAVQCPVGYRDGPGADNIYMCYANGATSCSAYLSFDSANVNYATSDVSLPCKRYYGTDRCVPDNLAACNISSFSCLSNYNTVAWNFESLTTPNSYAVKKASRGECYWMDENSSLEDCDNPVFSNMAPGDWKWEYPDKTFYGVARCSATAGTNFESGNPDFTNAGDNCWCRIEKINNQTAVSSWFNISVYGECSNCASTCGLAAFVSSDYVGAITGTLTQQCVAPSTISLSYTDSMDDTIYDGPNSCNINETFILPPAPMKTGYTFAGWTLVEN